MDKTTTQLFNAAIAGDEDRARSAILAGADIDAKDKHGNTPLHCAFAEGHANIVKLLESAARQQDHAGRITKRRKDKGPPQVGG